MTERPRALDVSTGVGAAYASKLLAETGWDVVKVEPAGGDPLRERPSRWGGGVGGAFAFANYGKRGARCSGQGGAPGPGSGGGGRDRGLLDAGAGRSRDRDGGLRVSAAETGDHVDQRLRPQRPHGGVDGERPCRAGG